MDEAAKAAAAAERDAALSVDCPVCGVTAGERCLNTVNYQPGNFVHSGRVARWEYERAPEEHDRAAEVWAEGHYQPGVSDPADGGA